MPVLSNSSAARRTLQTAAVTGALIATSLFSAAAQQVALTPDQCREARAVVSATFEAFKGRISPPFANSLSKFSETCDMNTDFERTPGIDDSAFKQFRAKIHAIRTAQINTPVALNR